MMRPAVGNNVGSPAARKRSVTELEPNTEPAASSNAPTTFFLASERQLDAGQTPTASLRESSFGVRSFGEEHAQAADNDKGDDTSNSGRRRSTLKLRKPVPRDDSMDSLGLGSTASSESSSPSRLQRQLERLNNVDYTTHPLTPLSFQSPNLDLSEPSSPKSMSSRSLRPSDDEFLDDRGSQAIMSDSEDDEVGPALADNEAAPQFIMPSIMMPSRRPFTAKGQELGKLKILLAGRSGVGKTSLIRSIVQLSEDIVHIDSSIEPTLSPKKDCKAKSRTSGNNHNRTKRITEIFASTKAYPSWWSDLDDSKLFKRRKSGNDTVLERNICFVDTPGFDSGISVLEGMENVSRYIEGQMNKSLDAANLEDAELLGLLGGSGGSQVDVVLYVTDRAYKPEDLEFMRQLSQLTNVMPLLAKADCMDNSEADNIKSSMTQALSDAGIKTFEPRREREGLPSPIVVCSSPSKDLENMDASLLMQSNYIQPLQPSELPQLISHFFSQEVLIRLKHFSAKKILHLRKKSGRSPVGSPSPFRTFLSPSSRSNTTPAPLLTESFSSVSQALIARPQGGALTYTQAQVTDHTLREERLARVHLANWATNLQRSLQNERARYSALARAERSEWLKARLGECLLDGDMDVLITNNAGAQAKGKDLALVPSSASSNDRSSRNLSNESRTRRTCLSTPRYPGTGTAGRKGGLLDATDPLGLMKFGDRIQAGGWIALKVLGVGGLLGALALWATRMWNWQLGMGAEEGGWIGWWAS